MLLVIFLCDRAITNAAEGKLYSSIAHIPYRKTGLLLGTSRYLVGGLSNPYYAYRIDAAVRLLQAGKITYIVISGDNSSIYYNEPAFMRADLLKAGVDSACIYSDYAGFRTFDSMVRLKAIFGQDSVTVISQPFQNERAIYIASREGIAAIGFNAQDVDAAGGFKVQVREKLARVKVFIDYLLGAEPKFLGEKVNIPRKTRTDTASLKPDTIDLVAQTPALAKQVLLALKNKDYTAFANFIHPLEGVRFSPYGFVDTTSDIVLSPRAFLDELSKKPQTKITWGEYDGTGEPIVLTIEAYFKKFVYNADFLNAPQNSWNEMIGSGNSLNNLTTIYKDCAFTEHHFPGFNQKYSGMDWCSLRLVFKKYNNQIYLVGIVHDQWTI